MAYDDNRTDTRVGTHRRGSTRPSSPSHTSQRDHHPRQGRKDRSFEDAHRESASRHALSVAAYGAIVFFEKVERGLQGLKDIVFSKSHRYIGGKVKRSIRGSRSDLAVAVLTAGSLVAGGVAAAPTVQDWWRGNPGEDLLERAFVPSTKDPSVFDNVLTTRVGWMVDILGPEGAGLLTPTQLDHIEQMRRYNIGPELGPDTDDTPLIDEATYERYRDEFVRGIDAISELNSVLTKLGVDSEGRVQNFDMTNPEDVELAREFDTAVGHYVAANFEDESFLELPRLKQLRVLDGAKGAIDRVNSKLDFGDREPESEKEGALGVNVPLSRADRARQQVSQVSTGADGVGSREISRGIEVNGTRYTFGDLTRG